MINIKTYKRPILSIFIIIAVLMVMIAVGFTIGILSTDPDGLEKVLINQNGESWLENLTSPWIPILSWITNDYGAGIVGMRAAAAKGPPSLERTSSLQVS